MCIQCRHAYVVVRILCAQAANLIDDYTFVNRLDVNMFITAFHVNQQYLIIRKLYLGPLHASTDSLSCRVMREKNTLSTSLFSTCNECEFSWRSKKRNALSLV